MDLSCPQVGEMRNTRRILLVISLRKRYVENQDDDIFKNIYMVGFLPSSGLLRCMGWFDIEFMDYISVPSSKAHAVLENV